MALLTYYRKVLMENKILPNAVMKLVSHTILSSLHLTGVICCVLITVSVMLLVLHAYLYYFVIGGDYFHLNIITICGTLCNKLFYTCL